MSFVLEWGKSTGGPGAFFFCRERGCWCGIGWWFLRKMSVSRYVVSNRRYIRSCDRYNWIIVDIFFKGMAFIGRKSDASLCYNGNSL
ncbi:hypothetical protein OCD90_18890 [Bacillus pacificus]|uniref:hypothetical protein n=1 Tax=Bacillus TaxID=1386 RepID=UPI0003601BD1|nr:hypothetical protein [Bacillus pacificus]MCC2419498.1 hypothetical protein [Bacillus pacificus]MCU5008544.1 hypothetical protein [Bacillus pacificus]MCU5257816.1 hypothetical protein [Bacillus pacificus]MCU5558298.1 hypothetical protein [Bacillus pacificus]HDR3524451.1 hypothetical protein [Bacillus pacificus]